MALYGLTMTEIDEIIDSYGHREVGELVASGANIMQGYWRDPDQTAQNFTANGFWKSGDTVELEIPMPARCSTAMDQVLANRDRLAITAGATL